MSTTTEASQSSATDIVKWLLVTILVAAAVVGNAYFDSQPLELFDGQPAPLFYRVVAIVVLGILAALVASFTVKGQAFIALLQDARAEVRRVVWPTKQETAQTTGIVVLVVALMALLLWGLDSLLGLIISEIVG